VNHIDTSKEAIKLISNIFSYYTHGWVINYFNEFPKIIQVDKSHEKLQAIKDELEKTFQENIIKIDLEVTERPGILPLENIHCRHLLGNKLSQQIISKRKNTLSPVTISFVAFFFIIIIAGIAITVQIAKYNSYDPVKEQETINSVTYPEETAILKKYSGLLKTKIKPAEYRIRAPGSIHISGNPSLKIVSLSYTLVRKKIKEIRFRFRLNFTEEMFETFSKEFIKFDLGGGKTKSGKIIPPEKAAVNNEKEIIHKEFTISFSDYHDPMEYWNWLLNRPVKRPDLEIPFHGKNNLDNHDEIIDEDDKGNPIQEKEIKKPEPIGKEMIINFKVKRNNLAREVFVKTLDTLKNIINKSPKN
jgi:hypothetical protein